MVKFWAFPSLSKLTYSTRDYSIRDYRRVLFYRCRITSQIRVCIYAFCFLQFHLCDITSKQKHSEGKWPVCILRAGTRSIFDLYLNHLKCFIPLAFNKYILSPDRLAQECTGSMLWSLLVHLENNDGVIEFKAMESISHLFQLFISYYLE